VLLAAGILSLSILAFPQDISATVSASDTHGCNSGGGQFAHCAGKYVAQGAGFGVNRQNSIPRNTGEKDWNAWSSYFGASSDQLTKLNQFIADGKIKKLPPVAAGTRYNGKNTVYHLYDSTNADGDNNRETHVNTIDSIHALSNQDFSGIQVDEWWFVDDSGNKVGDKPVYAQKYICFNPLVFNKDLIDNPPIDENADEIQAEAQSLIKKTKDSEYKPEELQITAQETVDFKHTTKNPGPNWTEAEWKIYEINKTAKTQEQLNSEKEDIATIGREIQKGKVQGDKLKTDASEDHLREKVRTSHLGEKDRICQVVVIVAKNAAGQAVAGGDWVCATPDKDAGKCEGALTKAEWEALTPASKKDEYEQKGADLYCPKGVGGDPPGDPKDPEITIPPPPTIPETAQSGSKIVLPPYALLTEVRNITKDTKLGAEDWKNWMYEYDHISVPDVKNLANSSGLNIPSVGTTTSCVAAMTIAVAANIASPGSVSISGSCPPNRLDYSYKIEYGGNSKTVTSFGSPPKVQANKSAKVPKPKAEPKDYVLAKPTDAIQFRHTVEKGWWGVKADNGTVAPAQTSTGADKEICKISTTQPKGPLGVETDPGSSLVRATGNPATELLKEYPCTGRDNAKWGSDQRLSNLIPKIDGVSEEGYTIRPKATTLLNIKQEDVGKTFEQQIDTYPTWAYEDEYQCKNEINKTTTPDGATIGGVQFKSNDKGVWCGTPNADTDGQTTKVVQGGNGKSSARALVPFNYILRPTITANPPHTNACTYPKDAEADAADKAGCQGDDVPADKKGWPNYGLVYASESFSFNSHVITNSRANPDVTGAADDAYATYTKKTKWQIVSFATTSDSPKPKGFDYGSADPCAYYAAGISKPSGRDCLVLRNGSNKVYNEHGDTAGGVTNDIDTPLSTDVIIDDLPVGSKICFAAAVWPADSHNQPRDTAGTTAPFKTANANIDASGTPQGVAMKNDTASGDQWAYGAPYCVTIAKKPNFQVWGGGVFTEGGMNTSQSPKLIGGTAGDPALATNANKLLQSDPANANRTIFGSWSEWEVVSLGDVTGFGSGAAFGYSAPAARAVAYGGGLQGFDAATASLVAKTVCATSKMTLANDRAASALGLCNGRAAGGADVSISTQNMTLLRQLMDRYLGSGGHGPSEKIRNAYHIDYMTSLPTSDVTVPSGRVYVYDLRWQGKAKLEHNITYADSDIRHNDGPNTNKYKAISELPQALIFANDLEIAANVTNIDAWIILEGDGVVTGNGTLFTCADEVTSAADCTNPLTINGPVYASQILLGRTYGAFPGTQTCNHGYTGNTPANTLGAPARDICQNDSWVNGWKGSVAPAERFVLRIDTFWWAYSQASITPKAVSVHTYEPSLNF
jgi:hypothetical protein